MQFLEAEWLEAVRPHLPLIFSVFGGAVVLLVAARLLRRKAVGQATAPAARIDLQGLSTDGPPTSGPRLELHHVPVRLAVVVVAPVGRMGAAPPVEAIPELLDHALPGMAALLVAHRPLVRTLPPQLSGKGFAHATFANLHLPGGGSVEGQGKGTLWSLVAGRIEVDGQLLQLALVCRADKPNSIGGVLLDQPGQWFDVLQIKEARAS